MSQGIDRRRFLGGAACLTAGAGFVLAAGDESVAWASEGESLGIVGPKQGYAPHLGTLSSMMAFMRNQVSVQ